MGAVIVLTVVISIWRNDLASLAAGIPLIGVISFTGIYLETRRLRHAIAGSIVLIYISLLGFFFNGQVHDALRSYPGLKDLYNSFTPLVGTVVAFYFGTDAAERINAARISGDSTGVSDAASREATTTPDS